MKNTKKNTKNTKTSKTSQKDTGEEHPQLFTMGYMDLIFSINLTETDLLKPPKEGEQQQEAEKPTEDKPENEKNENEEDKYYKLEDLTSIQSLNFMKEKKEIYEKFKLAPGNKHLKHIMLANKISKKKSLTEYVCYGRPKFEDEEVKFFDEIFDFVTKNNGLLINKEPLEEGSRYSIKIKLNYKGQEQIISDGKTEEEEEQEKKEREGNPDENKDKEENPPDEPQAGDEGQQQQQQQQEEKPENQENQENQENKENQENQENQEGNEEEEQEEEEEEDYEENDMMKMKRIPKFKRQKTVLANLKPMFDKYPMVYFSYALLEKVPGNYKKKDMVELLKHFKSRGSVEFMNYYAGEKKAEDDKNKGKKGKKEDKKEGENQQGENQQGEQGENQEGEQGENQQAENQQGENQQQAENQQSNQQSNQQEENPDEMKTFQEKITYSKEQEDQEVENQNNQNQNQEQDNQEQENQDEENPEEGREETPEEAEKRKQEEKKEKEKKKKEKEKKKEQEKKKKDKEMALENDIYFLTDIYFFDTKEACALFDKHYKHYTEDKTKKQINKSKVYDYFIKGIAPAVMDEVPGSKVGLFMDDFTKFFAVSASKKSGGKQEFECQPFPKVNAHNLKLVDEYKAVIKEHKEEFYDIFISAMLAFMIPAAPKCTNIETIFPAFLIGLEIVKKEVEIYKNKIELDEASKEKILKVQLNQKQVEKSLEQIKTGSKEDGFVLDCTNKDKSTMKDYVALYDYHLRNFFSSDLVKKDLKEKGFINSKGFIMYDPVYKSVMGSKHKNTKKLEKEEFDSKLKQSIGGLNIPSRIKDKDVDCKKMVESQNSPTDKKIPMYNTMGSAYLKQTKKDPKKHTKQSSNYNTSNANRTKEDDEHNEVEPDRENQEP